MTHFFLSWVTPVSHWSSWRHSCSGGCCGLGRYIPPHPLCVSFVWLEGAQLQMGLFYLYLLLKFSPNFIRKKSSVFSEFVGHPSVWIPGLSTINKLFTQWLGQKLANQKETFISWVLSDIGFQASPPPPNPSTSSTVVSHQQISKKTMEVKTKNKNRDLIQSKLKFASNLSI